MATRNRIDAEPPQDSTPPLHLKYRPQRLAEVRGQDAVVKALKSALEMKARPHVFLFTGPAGTGKTTLAHIVAREVGVRPGGGILEIDAASNSGIDDMRRVTDGLAYQSFGEHPNKAIILNECQGLSKQAWDSLLDTTERPPEHAYFMFTSTHPAKIPAAMVTRCQVFHLKPLRRDDILDELERVCDAEGFKTGGKVLGMVADACGGSMRGALTMLANVHGMEDLDDVADVLETPLDSREFIELCRLMVSRKLDWERLTSVLKDMEEVPAETARIICSAYLSKCLMGARDDRDAQELLFMLRQFSEPFDPATKNAPLLLAFGRVIFG